MRPMSAMKFPAVMAAIESPKPVPTLLIRQNQQTGRFSYKRTGKSWIGGFATEAEACAEAERLGLQKPYVIERSTSKDAAS
jgi:hypothetical protein